MSAADTAIITAQIAMGTAKTAEVLESLQSCGARLHELEASTAVAAPVMEALIAIRGCANANPFHAHFLPSRSKANIGSSLESFALKSNAPGRSSHFAAFHDAAVIRAAAIPSTA